MRSCTKDTPCSQVAHQYDGNLICLRRQRTPCDIVALRRRRSIYRTTDGYDSLGDSLLAAVIVRAPPTPDHAMSGLDQSDNTYVIECGVIHANGDEDYDRVHVADIVLYEGSINFATKRRFGRCLASDDQIAKI